jgi:Ca-activated chloride channel family protein
MRKLLSAYPKWLVFALAGLLGAGLFNAAHELIELLFFTRDAARQHESSVGMIFYSGVWFCFPSVGVVIAVFLCQRVLLGAEDFLGALLGPLALGVSLGFLSGAAAQLIFQSILSEGSSAFFVETIRVFAWGLAGGALGLSLSLAIPNLSKQRAFLYGVVGGVAGGVGFIIAAAITSGLFSTLSTGSAVDLASIAARLVGTSIIGLFIGLSVAVAEATAKEGYLRVVWGPGEFTRVNLGEKPVTVGSSRESTIRMASSAGYPPIVATFSLQGGRAQMVNHMSRSTHALRNGNKLTLGSVVIEIHLFS